MSGFSHHILHAVVSSQGFGLLLEGGSICDGRLGFNLLLEPVSSGLEILELLHKPIIWVSLLPLGLNELECILQLHAEYAHEKH